LIIFESLEEGKKEQTDSKLMTLRFLAVQLFAANAIALASDLLHLARPSRMKWKPLTVGVTLERPTISKPA
jgi:hypothetical protein